MKKIVSVLLALTLVFSMAFNVLAYTVSSSIDKTLVHAGETVDVTVNMDQSVDRVITFAYRLYFDPTYFELTSSTIGTASNLTQISSKVKTDAKGSYYNLSVLDTQTVGVTVAAGPLYTLTFTAKEDITDAADVQFEVTKENLMLDDFKLSDDGEVQEGKGVVSVTVQPKEVKAYTVSLTPETQSVIAGDDAIVAVSVGATGYESFNALDMTFTYDASKLSFNKEASTIADAYIVSDKAGTLRIAGFGEKKELGEVFRLAFTNKATGEASVRLTAAKLDESANAGQDAPDAAIANGEAKINVTGYKVTLPADFEGASVAEPNQDYTFTAKDTHYDYTFDGSTMGGEAVNVVDNGDGTFTVQNVTGNLVINSTKKAKTYPITVTGSGKSDLVIADKASYGVDYTFQAKQDSDYDYTYAMTIGGKDATLDLEMVFDGTYFYTIKGADIVGDIVINVEKTKKAPTTTSIIFTGSGSGDVKGGTTQTATNGQDFLFELNQEEGYDYTVQLGDEELQPGDDGKYTISADKLTGTDLAVTVEKIAKSDLVTEVSEYLKLDGTSMWLVTATATVAEGKVLAYDGTPMFWSEKYQAYAYLVISEKSLAELKEEAAGKVAEADAAKTEISYDYDINETGLVDANDAQFVYNMYNARYASFTEVAMIRFLKADCNGDKVVDVLDANAVIADIMK